MVEEVKKTYFVISYCKTFTYTDIVQWNTDICYEKLHDIALLGLEKMYWKSNVYLLEWCVDVEMK